MPRCASFPALKKPLNLSSNQQLPVLLQQVRGYGSTMVEAAARIDRPYVATEDANHRTNHAVVGALVVRTWGLPPVLAASVRLHHDFTAAVRHAGELRVILDVRGALIVPIVARHRRGPGYSAIRAAQEFAGLRDDLEGGAGPNHTVQSLDAARCPGGPHQAVGARQDRAAGADRRESSTVMNDGAQLAGRGRQR